MLLTAKNIVLVLKDQMPMSRFFRNFFITRNAWGLFHINSHVSTTSNKEKIKYNRKVTAEKAAISMQKKTGYYYSNYKCMFCDGYHICRNKKQ